MKNISLLIFLLIATLFITGCYRDKGNYDYTENEEITITQIKDSYTIIAKDKTLSITPIVKSSDPQAVFEYSWGIYETNVQGYTPILDTISHTKDLNMTFERTPKVWVLVFSAKNKHTGYEKIVTSYLEVVTPFTQGWYILKDNGIKSDIDLFEVNDPEDELSTTGIVRENIILSENGYQLDGKGSKLQYTTNWRLKDPYLKKDVNTKVIMAISEHDLGLYRLTNLKLEHNSASVFFGGKPDIVAPNYLYIGDMFIALANNGLSYAINTMTSNSGHFGMPMTLDKTAPEYRMSKYIVSTQMATVQFDELSHSFISAGYYGDILYSQEGAQSDVPVKNTNLDCLYMGYSNRRGWGVFSDITTGKRSILNFFPSSALNIKKICDIAEGDKAATATLFTVLNDENVLYMVGADGNVYSRLLTEAGTEMLQFDAASKGETVSFLRQVRWQVDSELIPNYIIIGTYTGSGDAARYKLRGYQKLNGSLDGEPVFELSGKGMPRDVIYMWPTAWGSAAVFYGGTYL